VSEVWTIGIQVLSVHADKYRLVDPADFKVMQNFTNCFIICGVSRSRISTPEIVSPVGLTAPGGLTLGFVSNF